MPELFFARISGLSRDTDISGLSAYRRERLRAVGDEGEYRRSLGAGLLLRRAVERLYPDIETPLDLMVGEQGKPELRGGRPRIGLSHSGELVLCVLSEGCVGADLQKPSSYSAATAKRFFTAGECESLLAAGDRDKAFTRLWCLKESYLKWLGTGLHRSLSSFEVEQRDGEARIAGDSRCRLLQGELEDYQYAVCACADDGELTITEIVLP